MRTRKALYLPALFVPLLLVAQVWGEKDETPQAAATYIGAKSCRACHMRQHRAWKKMPHAAAWDKLPADFRAPDKRDAKGRACLSCHVTGYGEPGGFVNATESEHLLGVQCEACHGPGSRHKALAKKLSAAKQKFQAGQEKLIRLKPTNCADCHNPHVSYARKYGPKAGG